MDTRHLEQLREIEADYWWHVNKRRVVVRFLSLWAVTSGRLLEVGCGGGLLSAALTRDGWNVVAGDRNPEALAFAREQGVRHAVAFDANAAWPVASGRFDLVLMLDVLEHLADDAHAARELHRVLRPGGAALLTVPAHPFLFSDWDRLLGHYRRYRRAQLVSLVQNCGLKPLMVSYWNTVAFLPAFVLRGKYRLWNSTLKHAEFPHVPSWVNKLLKLSGWLESLWLPRSVCAFGLSLAALGIKE